MILEKLVRETPPFKDVDNLERRDQQHLVLPVATIKPVPSQIPILQTQIQKNGYLVNFFIIIDT